VPAQANSWVKGPPEYHYLGWAVRPPPLEPPLECPWLDTVEPPDEDDEPDEDDPDEDDPDDALGEDDELPLEDGELAKAPLGSGRGLPPSLRGRTRVYPTPFTARAAPVPSFPSSSITTTDEP
jgi:hypothetical protein